MLYSFVDQPGINFIKNVVSIYANKNWIHLKNTELQLCIVFYQEIQVVGY